MTYFPDTPGAAVLSGKDACAPGAEADRINEIGTRSEETLEGLL